MIIQQKMKVEPAMTVRVGAVVRPGSSSGQGYGEMIVVIKVLGTGMTVR